MLHDRCGAAFGGGKCCAVCAKDAGLFQTEYGTVGNTIVSDLEVTDHDMLEDGEGKGQGDAQGPIKAHSSSLPLQVAIESIEKPELEARIEYVGNDVIVFVNDNTVYGVVLPLFGVRLRW